MTSWSSILFVRYTFLKKKAMVLEAFGKSVEFTNCKVTCQVRLVGQSKASTKFQGNNVLQSLHALKKINKRGLFINIHYWATIWNCTLFTLFMFPLILLSLTSGQNTRFLLQKIFPINCYFYNQLPSQSLFFIL